MPRVNPAPLKSALFLRNPSRRKSGSRRRKSSRRNGLAIRANGLAIRTNRTAVKKLLKRMNRRRNGLAIRANGRKGSTHWSMPKGLRRLPNGRFASKSRSARRANGRKGSKRYAGRRRNGLAIRANGRRNWMSRTRKNRGSRKTWSRRRRNPGMLSKTTGFATRMVRKVPFVGKTMSKYVGPAMISAVAFLPIHFALKYAGGYLPEQAKPFAYTIGGLGIATLGSMFPKVTKNYKAVLGASAVGVGVLIDLYRYASDKYPTLSGFLGDGGAWDVVPMDNSAPITQLYADATGVDAYYSGADFSGPEMKAARLGSRGWLARFRAGRRLTGVRRPGVHSRHAGQPGHRWGWLINLVGWDGFRRLMAMPPAKRMSLIARFRKHALTLVQSGSPAALPEYQHVSDVADPDLAGLAMRLNGVVVAGARY